MTKPKFIDLTEPFVSKYVFCLKRANHAQIHVSICEKKCKSSAWCAEYQRYLGGAGQTGQETEIVAEA